MKISEALLTEFEEEIKKTRNTLARVPADGAFKPHSKSMSLGVLAGHVAELPKFGETILTTPALDFGATDYKPFVFESVEQVTGALDEGAAKVRKALAGLPESAWDETWKLSFKGKTIFEGSRFLAYREMFLNHLVHHRAQLGVYLRLKEVAVPGTYGPSADEPF